MNEADGPPAVENESGSSILVADDNEDIRFLLTLMLKGYNLYQASNGAEAIKLYQTYHPALVLMDVIMPIKDGVAATIEILKDDPGAKIIAFTARNLDQCQSIIDAGALEFIEKPFNQESILEIVHKYIN
jgi:two-component system chemotaxis response regulator CheY